MIRSAMTLSISSRDAQDTSFLVNGTHLGLLSSISQSTHVQTSGRPVQMVVALRDEEMASGSSLIRQKQQVSAWKEFLQIVSRHPVGDLNTLLQQYHLFPEWMVLFDENRLQAWLSEDDGFYLLRGQELRRLKPIVPRVEPDSSKSRQYYSLTIAQHDQVFILPPALFSLFTPGEATDVLLGLRQLPAKVGDLIRTARLRGLSEDFTWLAIQVALLQADHPAGERGRKDSMSAGAWLTGLLGRSKRRNEDETSSESVSMEYHNGDEAADHYKPVGIIKKFAGERWLPIVFSVGILLLVLVVAAVLLLSNPPGGSLPKDTTESSASAATATPSPVPTLTPSIQPTQPPTPTIAPQLIVSVRRLNLRSQPTRDSELILTLENGDLLYQLEDAKDEWVMVRTMDGREGYVFYDYVQAIEDN